MVFALSILGDRWTLLVVRDLLQGRRRFKELTAVIHGIPSNILAHRLDRLVRGQIIVKIPYCNNSKWMAYELTAKGKALAPVLREMTDWGMTWQNGDYDFTSKPN